MSDVTVAAPPAHDALTGAYVREVREHFKLGRQQFQDLCGFEGKSAARIANIETKDSWKPGDKERVFAFVNRLLTDPDGALAGVSTRGSRRPTKITGDAARNDASSGVDAAHVDYAATGDGASTGDVVISFDDQDALELLSFVTPEPTDDAQAHYAGQTPVASGASIVVDLPTPQVIKLPPVPEGGFRVSNGMLQTWRRCPRKWWLAWGRQLALKSDNPTSVRSTGTRVHKALAAYYAPPGQRSIDPRDALERIILDDWTAIRDEVYAVASDENEAEMRLSELANDFNSTVALERAMIEGYVEWLTETGMDAELEVVTAESPQVAYVDVDGMSVQVASLTDTRVRRKTDDALLFIDHKTVGDFKSPTALLHMNPQMLHYHLVEWLNTEEGERRCDGALYNMLRRVKRTGSAKPPFFDRVESHHNDVQLDSYRRQLVGTVRRILAAKAELAAGGDHQEVVPPTVQDDCRWSCDFFPVCHMLDDGSHAEAMIEGLYRKVNPWDRYDGLHVEDDGANAG